MVTEISCILAVTISSGGDIFWASDSRLVHIPHKCGRDRPDLNA
jgi:hypothetical protein